MKKMILFVSLIFVSLGIAEVSKARPGYGREQIQCGSVNYQYRECGSARIVKVIDARLIQQQSKSACNKGSSWGKSSGGVWVDKGCRGTFEILGISL